MTFKDLHLNAKILKAVAEQNYTTPTPIQEVTIPLVLDGIDVIGCAQTGTGKTAAFALPILDRLFSQTDASTKDKKIKALIVSPTRELAVQIEENFKSYSTYTNLRTTSVYGGMSMEPQIDQLNKGVDILIATPGRLLDLHKRDLLNLDYVQILVLDEADMMLDMGFIDDVKKIERLCPPKKQTLLFSATMPPKIEALAKELLTEPEKVSVSAISSAAKTVSQELYMVPKPKKIELCLHLLRNDLQGNILIFRRTKFGVDKLEETLLKNKYKVDTIHGDKTQAARTKALNKFKNNDVNILIATDVAARGIDVPDLDIVINFDLPNIPESYVHRIGRTGRAGKEGRALAFCSADEKPYLKDIQQLMGKFITVEENHPYPLDPAAKPEVHKKQGSKYKKGRKSEASKAKKKRWY
ncbi:DEAD/DEAH box helicase [Wenyingzhuangia sp. chi5]|uniref:DEAD/DEAH box helicase n=1 Tax=Wenyingzhuangia gilva TaxID=3057677 RepID=A0ABT8VSD8_9FLAO|nr:DEAD/DEAH box helicase [Wenyingzhuangia sp. chi5]MDO3694897.1 DEAD/DEAH box helicase [Wenyingzhuangia sp. chi5]